METKAYEIGYLVRSEEDRSVIFDHLKRAHAEILHEGEIKGLRLSYPIEHQGAAYFGYAHFSVNPEAIAPLGDALKLESKVVRSLIVTPPFARDKRQGPSPEPTAPRRVMKPVATESSEGAAVSNDLLEEKLEEILK